MSKTFVTGEVLTASDVNTFLVSKGIGSNVVQTVLSGTFSSSVDADTFNNIIGFTAAITPTTATSLILVVAQINVSADRSTGVSAQLFRNGSLVTEAAGSADETRSRIWFSVSRSDAVANDQRRAPSVGTGVFLDSPTSADEQTYSLRIGHNDTSPATLRVNQPQIDTDLPSRHRAMSSLTLIEVAP